MWETRSLRFPRKKENLVVGFWDFPSSVISTVVLFSITSTFRSWE